MQVRRVWNIHKVMTWGPQAGCQAGLNLLSVEDKMFKSPSTIEYVLFLQWETQIQQNWIFYFNLSLDILEISSWLILFLMIK